MADPSGRPQSSGVARRRRERRLRSMLRHERMTVAMALAEFSHHSSRGQRTARAGGHEQNYTSKVWKPPTPQPDLFSLEEEPGGGLPAPLSEVAGRQEKVVRVCPLGANPRCSCAADGWRRYRHLAVPGFPDCRAGCRSAQDLLFSVSFSFSYSCAAVSGTVDGSADSPVSHAHRSSDRGADRRHFSSSWSWQAACSRFFPRTESTATPSVERISERTVEQNVDISSGAGLGTRVFLICWSCR